MTKAIRNTLGAYAVLAGLSFMTLSSAHAVDPDIGHDEIEGPLRTKFAVPMEFTTDGGTLSLTIINDPNEKNHHYMRALNLPESSDFLKISHGRYMDWVVAAIEAAEEYEENISTTPPSSPESTDINPRPMKRPSVRNLDNPIYPLAFQGYETSFSDKFALPTSVLTIQWVYTITGKTGPQANLRTFPNSQLFYPYVFNNFMEKIREIQIKDSDNQFEGKRPLMYL